MSSEESRPLRTLTDPKAMRAIAHPTRIALLEALGREGTLTATEAAVVVGESPTNCAFHLRTLAKYGFVEEAGGGTGRRRPWQLKHVGFRFDEDTAEADGLARFLWQTWLDRLATVATRRAGFPEEWRQATGASETVLYLTPDEAKAFDEEMAELLMRYHDRLENPVLRPPGCLPLEHIQFTYPYDAIR